MNEIPAQVWAALIAGAVTSVGYYLNRRAAKRQAAQQAAEADRQRAQAAAQFAAQSDVSLSAESRQWLAEAKAEAREAKVDAAAARKEANEARADAEAAGWAMRDASQRFESVMAWIERVVRTAHENPDDLVRVVNGGPPELTASRLPKP